MTSTSYQHYSIWGLDYIWTFYKKDRNVFGTNTVQDANIMQNNSAYCNKIVIFFVRTVRTAERIIGVPLPSLQELYTSRASKNELRKSLWTPHTQPTLSLNCCPLVGATELWAPKQPDTRTVSPQAISHLNNT